jgi:hypothetical protein
MPETGYQRGGLVSWAELTTEAIETNPALIWPLCIDVFDKMRREDAQVGSVLRAVTLPIRKATWMFDPKGARSVVVKQLAEDFNLPIKGETEADRRPRSRRTRDRFSFPEHLRLALLELVFGHAYFEQVYDVESEPGVTHLKKLAYRPPRTIDTIKVARDGGLISIKQSEAEPIPVNRLVAYINDREGGNWIGQSLLRQAYKNWLLKDRMLRAQALTVERNGLGVPVYTGAEVPEGVQGEDREAWEKSEKDAGLALAKGFRAGEAAGASIPHSADLTLKGVEGRLPDTDAPIRYHDEQIARAVLAHFLNLGTETGSWALGSTFADFFTSSLNAVADQIEDVINQHVVEDLVDENWGPDEPAPRLVFQEIGASAPATAEAIKQLLDAKAIRPDENLEAFMRQTYSLPPADPETVREEPAPPVVPPETPEEES